MKWLAVLLIAVAFAAGIYIGYVRHPDVSEAVRLVNYDLSFEDLVEVNVSIEPPNVRLDSACRRISFDVTADQAMSIYNGIHGTMNVRPLTQDMMTDLMQNFGIEILQAKIDRFDDEIYYATITMRKDNEILVMDARPSDTIALALRAGVPVNFKKSLFDEKSERFC